MGTDEPTSSIVPTFSPTNATESSSLTTDSLRRSGTTTEARQVKLTTSMTCAQWSEPTRQSQLSSSFATLMGVETSRLQVECVAQSTSGSLLASANTTASSELDIVVFAAGRSTADEVSVDEASRLLAEAAPTQ